MPEHNDFNLWNEIKKELHTKNKTSLYPKKGEVWIIGLGKNIGNEQNGSGNDFLRPVLVIRKFNNQMFWSVPLSSKQKHIEFYYNFTDPNGLHVSTILCQLKLVSILRFRRKLYLLHSKTFEDILLKLKNLLSG